MKFCSGWTGGLQRLQWCLCLLTLSPHRGEWLNHRHGLCAVNRCGLCEITKQLRFQVRLTTWSFSQGTSVISLLSLFPRRCHSLPIPLLPLVLSLYVCIYLSSNPCRNRLWDKDSNTSSLLRKCRKYLWLTGVEFHKKSLENPVKSHPQGRARELEYLCTTSQQSLADGRS